MVRADSAGFLKVSALGIEEQRVRVTIGFVEPPETWDQLGHDYRVVVHVTTWSAADALNVPISALFRKVDQWAVYADDIWRAKTVSVQIGHRNNRMAEVLSGSLRAAGWYCTQVIGSPTGAGSRSGKGVEGSTSPLNWRCGSSQT